MLKTHSQKRLFANEIYQKMIVDHRIYVLTADLGYKMWDDIRQDFPDRFFNVGAAEHVMVDMGIGLSLSGMIPILYSITPFLLFRPFESIRNYINHEKIPVVLVGAGRDRDYGNNGISHWGHDDKAIMKQFPHIKSSWPESASEIKQLVTQIAQRRSPLYINLTK